MMFCGMSKKTLAVFLCISTVCVMLILNAQLRSVPRSTRYETRHTLSMPLTIDLSKNVTFIQLPDANNRLHRYKLERLDEPENTVVDDDDNDDDYWEGRHRHVPARQGEQPWNEKQDEGGVTDDVEDEFGDRVDEMEEANEKPVQSPLRTTTAKEHLAPQLETALRQDMQSSPNISAKVDKLQGELSYLLRVPDPRYPRMIGKVLSRLPGDVKKDMASSIRAIELHARTSFQSLPTGKQWQVILKVFRRYGYSQRFPDVINIGVKKSGTNALGFFLPEHPQIIHSIGNEVHYFDWMYEKGLDYYLSRMGFAKRNQLIFEKTPRYFVTAEVPMRIHRDLPTNPKFLLIVRNPISRLISDFRHESELKLRKDFKVNRSKYSSRTGAFEGRRLKEQILDSQGRVNASNELVDTSVYAKHYKNWLAAFPQDRIMVIDQDKMEQDVYREMKRLERFLGLEPFFKPSMFYTDERVHGICLRKAEHSPRNCPAKSTPSVLPKAELDPETLKKLEDFYRPMNQEFARLTGMDFAWGD